MTTNEGVEELNAISQRPSGLCARCAKAPATCWWSESVFAWTHGQSQAWCARCCCEEQLKFARDRAATIPELERQLAEMDAKEAEHGDVQKL